MPEQSPNARHLRIAVFSDALPERNGAGSYYTDLVGHLEPEVERIELFQPAAKTRFLSLALPMPGDRTQKLITPNFLRLGSQFRRLDPHVVIAVTPGMFGLLGRYLARRSKARFITAFHTHFEELIRLYCSRYSFRIAHGYMVAVNRRLCSRSETVLVNNPDLVKSVMDLGAPRADIMGTPLPRLFLEEPQVDLPTGLGRVLFAGRLAPEKNLPKIVEAARELPEVEFVLAGDGPLRKSIARDSADLPNVRMTGWLDRRSLLKEVDAASLLVLPSKMETFGTVALEAMARGRPALVAEGAGIHAWPALAEGLFILREDERLADSLRRIAAKPAGEWAHRGAAARLAAEKLNRETVLQWVEVLARGGPPREAG